MTGKGTTGGNGLIGRRKSALRTTCATSCIIVALGCGLIAGAAQAQTTQDAGRNTGRQAFNIASQDMASALNEFAVGADLEILYAPQIVKDKQSLRVTGVYSDAEVLDKLLAGSGLTYEYTDADTLLIRSKSDKTGAAGQPGRRTRLALLQESNRATDKTRRSNMDEAEEDDEEERIEEVIVTGSHIRGIALESSPTRTYTRQDILNSGAATAQDFIQTLPQNFGGGANESFRSLPGQAGAGSNDGNGSSINLRGLGAGSTLVLLNGRRIAPASDIGGFVDISMIPVSAIERIEVLTDGASSIYGADAVAGVVNFVLRHDYDGIEASLRFGTVTEGNLSEYRASLTGGKSWNSGNGLIVYEYYKRDNLSAGDRVFSRGFQLPNDLLPEQERNSVIGSISQKLSPDISAGGDILYSSRESTRAFTGLAGLSTGVNFNSLSASDSLAIGGNMNWHVGRDWYIDIFGNYSGVDTELDQRSSDGSSFQRVSSANLWSADAKASGTIFDLPGGPLKLAVGAQFRQEDFLNQVDGGTVRDGARKIYAFFSEAFIPIIGSDNALPGVRRLEINVSGRFEEYSDFGSTANPKFGVLYSPFEGLRFRGSYSTSFKAPSLGLVGALDRLATAAPSSFINAVFGQTAADASIADVVVLFVSGTSPDLESETSRSFSAGFDYELDMGQHNYALSLTYFDIEFENRIGLAPIPNNLNLLATQNLAFDSPQLFPAGSFSFFPSAAEIDDVLDSLNFPINSIFGADPLNTSIINRLAIRRNLSRTEVRGLDFEFTYSFDTEFGFLNLGVEGSYLTDFKQQGAVTTPLIERLDTQFNPIGLNVRGRIGYARDGLIANVFVNYSGDYRVDSTDAAAPIDSWTTIDVSLSYDTQQRFGTPLLENTVFRLTVLNLFNRNPPAAPSDPNGILLGFDPANATPLNRFISFEIAKSF